MEEAVLGFVGCVGGCGSGSVSGQCEQVAGWLVAQVIGESGHAGKRDL